LIAQVRESLGGYRVIDNGDGYRHAPIFTDR